MIVLETARLRLRWLTVLDAEFMCGLLNEPSYIANIGDKGVRTVEEARQFLLKGSIASYERYGHSLYLVVKKEDGVPVGICGLIYREYLKEVDVGYAFLPAFWNKGYAVESAAAVLEYGRRELGLKRIVALTSSDNLRSIRVIEKIGLRFEKKIRMSEAEEEIDLFA